MSYGPIDQSDFMRLFVRHERDLRVFARSLLPNWPAVDDVLQEASVVMWRKLHQLQQEEDFFTWARVIVRYEALRARRKAARDRLVLSEELLELLANEAMPTTGDELEKEREALNCCLKKMGDEQRTAHRNTNVPCLLTGGGFQGLTHGKHRLAEKENTPLANLWTTMLQDAGVEIDRFADANATANSIWG